MQFNFPITDKVIFYLRHFVLKVFYLWFEVRRPKIKMFLYEMYYSLSKLLDYSSQPICPFPISEVETVFGKFKVREVSSDPANVSPAFERRDIDALLRLIRRLDEAGKKVLFMDIGADLGTFTVSVGNSFWDDEAVSILAFEPAPSSYSLLIENIALNGLGRKATAINAALYSKDGVELDFDFNPSVPGTSAVRTDTSSSGVHSTVRTRTLDSVLQETGSDFDVAVMKLDVEGMEADVLDGATDLLNFGKDIYMLVEDFVKPSIVEYLEDIGARFIEKRTPYNSWWLVPREQKSRT